jgi:hypothetical protein
MAVSIDKVYQKVLALANKEQRGYITPQEFNLFADQAQMEIFEQYFYDLEQAKRRMDVDNDLHHQSIQDNLEDKLDMFFKSHQSTAISGSGLVVLDPSIYKLGMVRVTYMNQPSTIGLIKRGHTTSLVERITHDNHLMHSRSPLTAPTHARPTYKMSRSGSNVKIQIQPYPDSSGIDNLHLSYFIKPETPKWTYLIDPTTKNALYNPNAMDHQDFELHASEENTLIVKILQLAGVAIKDMSLTQYSVGKEVATEQKQKQ